MRTTQNSTLYITIALAILTSLSGCSMKTMSVQVLDETKGMNGSFEHSKEGLPVNWQLYTAQTVPSGDFDIRLDTTDPKEGQQSLQFVIRACAATGGWRSPGLARQMSANAGEVYNVSFWVKNNGGKFIAKISGISATEGKTETIVETDERLGHWKQYRYQYTIPQKMTAIRFELNALQAGAFWIDDVKIERI